MSFRFSSGITLKTASLKNKRKAEGGLQEGVVGMRGEANERWGLKGGREVAVEGEDGGGGREGAGRIGVSHLQYQFIVKFYVFLRTMGKGGHGNP